MKTIGEIDKVPLGKICKFLDSQRVPVTASDRNHGIYPYYGANGIQGWVDDFIFDEPLILLAEDGGHFGSKTKPIAYKITGKSWVNNHAHVIRPKSNCDIDYLHHVLSYYDVSNFINGATRPKLTKGNAEQIQIPLPKPDEQKRIATILDKADRLRRQRLFAQTLSDSFLQSVFIKMFDDPVSNPMNWYKVKLNSLGTLDRGKSKHRPRNAPHLYDGIYPFVQTGDISNATGYIKTFQQTYSEEGLNQSKLWKSGTLCITIAANIAKTAILTFDACFPDSVVGFTANQKTKVDYIQQWFSFVQRTLEETAPESAQKNINLEILRDLEIIAPPLPLQEKFAEIVQKFERVRRQQREATRQAEHLFQTLLHRAFRGEL